MLELKNVTINLKKDGRSIAENFSFTLSDGDRAVIIGEEGNGKSTLLKFICDRAAAEAYCDCSGEVRASGRIACLPQMSDGADNSRSLAEYFEGCDFYAHMPELSGMGVTPELMLSERKLETLSGGELVKIRLARLMMDDPDLLLLDEPTNDLDISTLEWLEEFMNSSKKPVLYISHDETLIENTANVIIHMEQVIRKTKSRITVTRASYRDYLLFRRNGFEHQRQVAGKQREDYDKQMEKWRRIYNRVEHEQSAVSRQDPGGARLLKKKMHSVLSMGKRFERQKEDFIEFPEEETAIITEFDRSISLPEGKTVLDLSMDRLCAGGKILSEGLRLLVAGRERVGIIGRNGAGKSTLLAAIWDMIKDRRDITPCYMPQNYAERLDYAKTPVEYLAENYSKADVTRARTYMGAMKFTHAEMTGKISELSGGQKAKLLFLEMVLKNADVLLLDEPTRNFSPLSGPVVRAALRGFGGTIISVSHDRKYLSEVCGRICELTPAGLTPVYIGDGEA